MERPVILEMGGWILYHWCQERIAFGVRSNHRVLATTTMYVPLMVELLLLRCALPWLEMGQTGSGRRICVSSTQLATGMGSLDRQEAD